MGFCGLRSRRRPRNYPPTKAVSFSAGTPTPLLRRPPARTPAVDCGAQRHRSVRLSESDAYHRDRCLPITNNLESCACCVLVRPGTLNTEVSATRKPPTTPKRLTASRCRKSKRVPAHHRRMETIRCCCRMAVPGCTFCGSRDSRIEAGLLSKLLSISECVACMRRVIHRFYVEKEWRP